MYTRLFFLLLLWQSLLLADSLPIYDIRGASAQLDENLSGFLEKWRFETATPVQNGTYRNVVLNGAPGTKTLALTFDDSPDENVTALVLDLLARYEVKASFFMIGSPMVECNATVVRRTYREGHLILNHSFTHPRLTALSTDQIAQELDEAAQRIHHITEHYPLLVRPPYGSLDPHVVETINAMGFTTVLWSLDSLDWAIREKNAIVANVTANVRDGDIILMHSGRSNHATVEALGEIIETLRARGYRFVRLDEMLGVSAYRENML